MSAIGTRRTTASITRSYSAHLSRILESYEDSQVKIRRKSPPRMAEICLDRHPKGSIRLSLSSIRPSIGTKNLIPEEMDHREIAVRVPVMNEMQFLFPSEPCKSLKPRSLYVVFLVEIDMRVERCRARD